MINNFYKCLSAVMLFVLAPLAHSQDSISFEHQIMQCKETHATDAEARLVCFDAVASSDATTKIETGKTGLFGNKVESSLKPLTYVERKWRLNSKDNWDLSDLETHAQNYLVTSLTSDVNSDASTPSKPNTGDRKLENKDVQFQISLKTQLIDDIPVIRDWDWVDSSRLWLAYTQKSYWQIYHGAESRPFRESNYAPEMILSLGVKDVVNGKPYAWLPRMVNLGFVHESNGQDEPISRSWNRFYLQGAWEFNDAYTVIFRPWYRLSEGGSDDNGDIQKFMGYGDLTLRWDDYAKTKAVSLLLRNNLRSDNKGYGRLSMSYKPFKSDNIKLYMMLSTGYGESLVDYNHSQTVFGLGFAVGE